MNRSVRAPMTSVELSLCFTRIVRHSRLNSFGMFKVRNELLFIGTSVDEIIAPDMIAMLWPKPDI